MAKKKVADETIIASVNSKPNVRDLRFGDLAFTSNQCTQVLDWMDGEEKIRLTIELVQKKLDATGPTKVSANTVIKEFKSKPNVRDLRFVTPEFSNAEYDQIDDWMDNKEMVRVTLESVPE